MNVTFAVQSVIEIVLSIFFIWGLFNESKLALVERKLLRKIFKKSNCRIKNLKYETRE